MASNSIKNAFASLINESSNRKWLILTGGIITAGIGGYFLYKKLKISPASDLPPTSASDECCSTSSGSSKAPQKTPFAFGDHNKTVVDVLDQAKEMKNEGNKFFGDHKYSEAIDRYTKAIEMCPKEQTTDLSMFYQNRAATYEKLGDSEKVIDDCTRALGFNKTYVKALHRRATASEKLGKLKDAWHDFFKCCILENFQREETAVRASNCVKKLSHDQAVEYMRKRRLESAPMPFSKTVIKATLRSFGCDPIFSSLGQYDEKNFEVNGQIVGGADSGDFTSPYEEIRRMLKAQNYEKVVQLCSEYVNQREPINTDEPAPPHFFQCLLLRSLLYNLCGAHEKACQDTDRVLEIVKLLEENELGKSTLADPTADDIKCSAKMMTAFGYHLAGDLEKALKELTDAETLAPKNADVFSLRGQIRLLHNGSIEEARLDFDRSINLKPRFIHYRIQLLACQAKNATENQNPSMMSSIMDQIKNLVVENPSDIDANMFFAQLLLEIEQIADASRHLDVAMRLDPNSADILAQKALVEMYSNRQESGLRMLNRALEVDPYCLMALEILAQHYSKLSDVPKMTECFDKALQVARSEAEVAHFISLRENALLNMQMAEEMLIS